jgi:putative endonuclease
MAAHFVYIVRCCDDSLYTGITTDIARRVEEHNTSPRAARYTRARRPVQLVYNETHTSRSAALKREAAIKKMQRNEKLMLLKTRATSTKKKRALR